MSINAMMVDAMNTMIRTPFHIILLGLLAGCAMPSDQGFGPVARDVKTRSGHDVAWLRDGESRQLADDLTASLLAETLTAETATRIALLNNRDLQATIDHRGSQNSTI